MALPHAFSNDQNPTGLELDANFAAVAMMGAVPCTVSGTNILTLAPIGSVPNITVYANYNLFSGVASATNTGPGTANVGSAPNLNVYKDTPAGPVALVSGDIVIGDAIVLMYDAALNNGAGGFHLLTQPQSLPQLSAGVSIVSAGAGTTLTAAQLGVAFGEGIVSRQGAPGAPYNDTTDTAANIIAAIPQAVTNSVFRFRVVNVSGQTQTLLAGVGVTLAGSVTTLNGASHDFIGVVTGSTTVSIYG